MFYTTQALDRADHLRRDDEQINTFRKSASARVVLYHQGTLLVDNRTPHAPAVAQLSLAEFQHDKFQTVFLGLREDIPWFAMDLSHHEPATLSSPDDHEWLDLRQTGPLMSADDGALLAYSKAIMHWQQQSRFCSICGHANGTRHAGHVRVCTNPACGRESFPRTDPAVIMLVIHEPTDGSPSRCLLGRSPAWPDGVFSTLAGFVEPGETLEHAVQREVFEEAGVKTTDVQYVASQPWPFPQSIMLGFRATATTTALELDTKELADAGWFTREELSTFGVWGDERYARQLPRPDSIARFLINSWIEQADVQK